MVVNSTSSSSFEGNSSYSISNANQKTGFFFSYRYAFSLLPAAAAATAASVAAAHLLLFLLYDVGAVQVVAFSLSVDGHAGRAVPSRDFKTAVRVFRSVPVVRALQRHGVDDDRAGLLVPA